MNIDLTKLNNNIVTVIDIDKSISIDENLISSTDILDLENIHVKGKITKNSTGDNILNVKVEGTMILEDSISLEEIPYQFSFVLEDEILKNEENDGNTLDLLEILWQNIVLEVPLKFTNVEDLSKFKGNGWKLVSEKELKDENNPFNDLKSLIGEE